MRSTTRRYRSTNNMQMKTKEEIINTIILIIAVMLVFIGVIFIKSGLDTRKKSQPQFAYTSEKSSNYEVLLKPNDFYLEKTLEQGKYYASQSIDKICINFKYILNTNKESNLQYSYDIIADLVGNANSKDNQIKEVWNRRFNLVEITDNQDANNKFEINQNVDVDYQKYVTLANEYEKTYGINIDSVLKVRMNVYSNVNNLEADIKKVQDYIELDIPINDTVTNVEENYQNINNENIVSQEKDISITEIIYYASGTILIIGAIIIVIIEIKREFKNMTKDTIYEMNIRKILKFYEDLIVTVENRPNLEKLEIMNVNKLDDLIDVAEQNKKNIIHYEEENKSKSEFYVIVDKYAYLYVVTSFLYKSF